MSSGHCVSYHNPGIWKQYNFSGLVRAEQSSPEFLLVEVFLSSTQGNMDGDIPNIKKWIVFCPIYINSKKPIAEGRRINASIASKNPTCVEIGDCCSYLKLPFAIEIDKAYPCDFMQRVRVRVLLEKEDGTLCNPAISSSNQSSSFP